MPDRAPRSDAPRHDTTTILLHWLTALLIGTLYALGRLHSLPGRGSALAQLMLTTHYGLGVTLAGVIVLRLAWRATHRAPGHEKGLMGLAARAGHIVLYLLVIATVALGMLRRWAGGHPIPFFGLFHIPALVDLSAASRHALLSLHALAANLVLAAAGLHAAAALLHHYVLRDEILHRMTPFGWRIPRWRWLARRTARARRALRGAGTG